MCLSHCRFRVYSLSAPRPPPFFFQYSQMTSSWINWTPPFRNSTCVLFFPGPPYIYILVKQPTNTGVLHFFCCYCWFIGSLFKKIIIMLHFFPISLFHKQRGKKSTSHDLHRQDRRANNKAINSHDSVTSVPTRIPPPRSMNGAIVGRAANLP